MNRKSDQWRGDYSRGRGAPGRGQHRGSQQHHHNHDQQRGLPITPLEPCGPLTVPDDKPTGSKGREIIVKTNYLPMDLNSFCKKQIFQYDVTMDPFRPRHLLPKVFEEFKKTKFPNVATVFDGTKFLLTLNKFDTEYCGEVNFKSDTYKKTFTFRVSLKFNKLIDLSVLMKYKNDTNIKKHQEVCHVLSIILRSYPLMHHISLGRNFYIPANPVVALTENMQLMNGLYQTPVLTQRGLLLKVDVVHKAKDIKEVLPSKQNKVSLLEFIRELCKISCNPQKLNEIEIKQINDKIKGKKVIYTVKFKCINYRINGFRKSAVEECVPGYSRSVQEYFLQYKMYKIQYPDLPLLWVGEQKRRTPILIPMELCTFDKNQIKQSSKNSSSVVRELIKSTIVSTQDRQNKTVEVMEKIGNYENSPYLKQFGIEIGKEFEVVRGRVLDPPQLQYGSEKITPSEGIWNLRGKFLNPVEIENWTIINLDNKFISTEMKKLEDTIIKVAKEYGVIMSPAKNFKILDQNCKTVGSQLETILKGLQNYKLLIVLFSKKNLYATIKQVAEVKVGCLTQCLLTKTVFNECKMNKYLPHLLLKINAKCNGINYTLAKMPAVLKGNVMLMGADVTHPPPGNRDMPSFAAVTTSHDEHYFTYNMVAQIQPPTEEHIAGLDEITACQLKIYLAERKVLPNHIIFYRDGVSEGDFDNIRELEVKAIQRACKTVKAYNTKITVIVVIKRHHTRLFPTNEKDTCGEYYNVPAGTCVDTGITHPLKCNLKDFYLASHSVRGGVTKPTKYCTIYDDANLKYDDVEELSYYLCHMYARCNKAVSYPAPTYYAHLAAERAKTLWKPEIYNWEKFENKQKKIDIKIQKMKMHFV